MPVLNLTMRRPRPNSAPRPLHLHTLDLLLADLIGGAAVSIGEGSTFALQDECTRSALEWYRRRGAANWTANVSKDHAEQLVDCIQVAPLQVPAPHVRPANANKRRLRLASLRAHRFAGLHKFGTPEAAPGDYVFEFSSPLTLFEGRNGSGKTSLANAILWALTGEIIRSQREPESASLEFECSVSGENATDQPTVHRITPVTPTPDVDQFRPDREWIPADTWVELTFVDEDGTPLPPIRRAQRRTCQGKLEEDEPDLNILGIDPIAVRIGTVMPSLIPHLKVGRESELGRAVAELTGLGALTDLASHALRAKTKIDKEFIRNKIHDRDQITRQYEIARDDVQALLMQHPSLSPSRPVPPASDEASIETTLMEMLRHFEGKKTSAFKSVSSILGDDFDPTDSKRRTDLEKSIGPALSEAAQPHRLQSIARLRGFRDLANDQLAAAKNKISEILNEAQILKSLAENPSSAARARLYARISTWLDDHPDPSRNEDRCVVCGGSLIDAADPISGKLVKTHIHEAKTNAALVSQTLSHWSNAAQGELARRLPQPLQAELATDLPEHPCDLLRAGIVEELFASEAFAGELANLRQQTEKAFDAAVEGSPPLSRATAILLPTVCASLETSLKRLDAAVRFAEWRKANDEFARKVFEHVLGRRPKQGEPPERVTLAGKLLELNGIVADAEPITRAIVLCGRLQEQMKSRRAAQKRLAEYQLASGALGNLAQLADLADKQVQELQTTLRSGTQKWRSRIYVSSFPSLTHELVDTSTGRKGQIGLLLKSGGVSAPAQHVANASALRASLIGFFFAFWEHVLRERGGLKTLVLDDPQELLDEENREHLAISFGALLAEGAQLVVTSYDRRFAGHVARISCEPPVLHLAVHPATINQPVIRTTPHQAEIEARRALYDKDRDAEEPARSFADGCRVFLESVLGDIFDEPAHFGWAKKTPNPTLADFVSRLRPSVVAAGHVGMLGMQVFKDFVGHPALVENSPVLTLMNKAHHGNRNNIRAGELAACANDLSQLVALAGRMEEECARWRRRDIVEEVTQAIAPPPELEPMAMPALELDICPDLAAFTRYSPELELQELVEPFDSETSGREMRILFAAP